MRRGPNRVRQRELRVGEVRRQGEYDDLRGTSTTTTQSTTVDADHGLWISNANAHMKALVGMYVAALASTK